MARIIGAVSIPGHRIIEGVCTPVTKILKILDDDCPQCEPIECYSDNGTATSPALWQEGKCNPPKYDFEPVLITDDNNETVEPGVSRWEIINGTPIQKLYDKDGNDVTNTHEIAKDIHSDNLKISEKIWFCDGNHSISRTDIIDTSGNNRIVVGSIRQDTNGFMIPAPDLGTITLGLCGSSGSTTASYNNVSHQIISNSGSLTIPANTVHAISYQIFGGKAEINIGGNAVTYPENSVGSDEATDLIAQDYVFTPAGGTTIIVKTIF